MARNDAARNYVKDTATQMGIIVGNAKVLQHRVVRRAAALNSTCNPPSYLKA
ncbi:hypothetical protein [Mycobacterium sp. JS623]|uniref:hypothetical protein n=1 Tax=Mycobacterium sp. JS623 TaxID=212767 RepID=UPI000310A19C|nr:hypothetical protein [Mycobacterium sp. JS623]